MWTELCPKINFLGQLRAINKKLKLSPNRCLSVCLIASLPSQKYTPIFRNMATCIQHLPDEVIQLIITQTICSLPLPKSICGVRIVMCISRRWYRLTRTCTEIWQYLSNAFGLVGNRCGTAEKFSRLWHSNQAFSHVRRGQKLVIVWCHDGGDKMTHPVVFCIKPRNGPFGTSISLLASFRCYCCGQSLAGRSERVVFPSSLTRKKQKMN